MCRQVRRALVTAGMLAALVVPFGANGASAVAAPSSPSANLAPDGDVELDPSGSYSTNGSGTFSWSTDAAHSGSHSLKLVSSQASGELARWMTVVPAMSVVPERNYAVAAWSRTQGVDHGSVQLVATFWSAAQVYVSDSATASPQLLVGTQDWTQVSLEAKAPAGAAFMRVELRLTGPGTMWADDVSVSQEGTTPPPAATVTIVSAVPDVLAGTDASTVTWRSSAPGHYVLRVGGTSCSTGTQIAAGDVASADADQRTQVPATALQPGVNTIRLCVESPSGTADATSSITLGTTPSTAPQLHGVEALSLGYFHTCALTVAGGVKCWGDDFYGELGDGGAETQRLVPTDVPGLGSGVIAIAAGSFHACALMDDRSVLCWGSNSKGQLGDGTTTTRRTPTRVVGLAPAIAIAAGDSHTCAVTLGGAVSCWGANGAGQVGDGTTTDRLVPTQVLGLDSGATAVSAGVGHTCALVHAGAKCWGANWQGELGDGTTTPRTSPVGVVGLSHDVTAISAADDHTCALVAGGSPYCWGRNDAGEIGDGTTHVRLAPVPVSGFTSGVPRIAAGGGGDRGSAHTCAITKGSVWCWGANDHGQVGDGSTVDRTLPTVTQGLVAPVEVGAGGGHTCAITSTREVACWGWNGEGQLGDGTTTDRSTPAAVLAGKAPNLVPDGDLEDDPAASYFTAGSGSFSWAADASHSPSHSLKLVSGQPSDAVARWMSRTTAVEVQPGQEYDVSAWLKPSAVDHGEAQLVVTYWSESKAYVPGSAAPADPLTGTRDWTRVSLSTTAPAEAAFMRVEFRLRGEGTLWVDDVSVVSGAPPALTATVTSFARPGIQVPESITAGPDGALWFTGIGNNVVGRITLDGQVSVFTEPEIRLPSSIVRGPDGALWFTSFGTDRIGRITTSGSISLFTDPTIAGPGAIAVGPDGALWFTNQATGETGGQPSIGRITTAGVVSSFTSPDVRQPSAITAGPDGALWFTDRKGSIGRISAQGAITTYKDASVEQPRGIVAGPDGALWFTNVNSVGRISTNGAIQAFYDLRVYGLGGIALGPDGALWFLNGGSSIGRISTTGSIAVLTDPALVGRTSITLGPDGALWYTSEGDWQKGIPSAIGRIALGS